MGKIKEEWKPVKDYEGFYEVSSLGKVKSLGRYVNCHSNSKRFLKGRVLKNQLSNDRYLNVRLSKNGMVTTKQIHQLVAESFLNHTPCGFKLVVNHIDFNKKNNKVSNLEIVTNRQNTNKKHIKSTSKYTGVHWCKRDSKWMSSITINGKKKALGRFTNELEASILYQKTIKEIKKTYECK